MGKFQKGLWMTFRKRERLKLHGKRKFCSNSPFGITRDHERDKLLDIIIKIIKDVFYHPENIANML